ncbi:GNAT family N-acetyltransferase [Streptomyces sp. 3MP-14]|uniref:GNAT family N-acetyltransferase n=1 Tax=Streptomyces mimosae TaxID=2586635 RepID=A0A5N5ZWI0_9ACTN|nr:MULTISPECIES: GNAT family protein [Streptomyces]KAB8160139.1 GNAT family N-acetyltransferase [Streptomyces mimosae]KAB8176692.1 GNAT family N-acetyltransferase [Streptomyces sp. 3MP-14]
MLIDHWPLAGLRLRTPRLELRLPDDEELAGLAELAAAGVHPPAEMPFVTPWTDQPPEKLRPATIQYHWGARAALTPERWELHLGVFEDGRLVGTQSLMANDFAVLRETNSGSWLGLAHQGRGIGTEMRAAVLELAFAGLGAEQAISAAMADNAGSLRVSAKLGYQDDGIARLVVRGRAVTERRLRLTRDRWLAHRRTPVEISGLEPCLALLGADGRPAGAAASAGSDAG